MKNKRSVQNLAIFKIPNGFRGRSVFFIQCWWIVQSLLFGLSPQFMYSWRNFLLRIFGAKIGKGVKIRSTSRITYPWNISLGDNVWIGDNVVLYSLGKINISNHAVISQKCYLCAASHDYSKVSFPIFSDPIFISEEVWLCTDVFVGPGVKIGSGTVVGARSSVFKSLPSMKVCFGSPVRIVRSR
jgi:putative colanic acid biosynthesis acetyltransferase WcaF